MVQAAGEGHHRTDDGGVLGGVVEIDMQVAAGAHLQIDHGMAAKAVQHVIQKADAGIDVANAGAVQIDHDPVDFRLLRGILAVQGGGDLLRADDAAPGQGRGDAGLDVADPVALQHAESRGPAIDGEADELHG